MIKKLGRLYAEFVKSARKTGNLKIQQDLQAAKNIEDGLNTQAFVDYINKNFSATTDAERKQKAEALEKIKGSSNWLAGAVDEFKAGYAEVLPDEEPDSDTKKVAAGTGSTASAPVEVQKQRSTPIGQEVAEISRRRRGAETPMEAPEVGESTPTLDTSMYEKYSGLGLIGNEQATISYIAQNEVGDAEIAFLMAAASDAPLRPKIIGDKVHLVPFPGHFLGVPLSDIIDNYASQGPGGEIETLQLFLEQNKIVPQNHFAGSRGEPSEELRQAIKVVMNYIDKNIYAVEGTALHDEIVNEMTNSPVFFTKTQELQGAFSFARQLFNYGLKEMAADAANISAAVEAEYAKDLAESYIPPEAGKLDDMVDAYFEGKLGRKPTEAEKDVWASKFAESYSISFRENRAKAEMFNNYNFLSQQPEYGELSNDATGSVPGIGNVDLSAFSTRSPADVQEDMFEAEFSKGIEAREEAVDKRQMQHDMFRYLLGNK